MKHKKYHTVYRVRNKINNKIYVGIHSTNDLNDNYLGSGGAINSAIKKYGREAFEKEILFVYDTEDKSLAKETEIVNEDFIKRSDVYNICLGGGKPPIHYGKGHHFWGTKRPDHSKRMKENNPMNDPNVRKLVKDNVVVIDKNGNTKRIKRTDKEFINGDVKHVNKGKVTVKDNYGNVFHVDKNDPRFLTQEIKHNTKGMFTAKDKQGRYHHITIDDPRYLSGELVGARKGVHCKDKNNKKYLTDFNDERIRQGILTPINDKKYNCWVKTTDGDRIRVSKNHYKIETGEYRRLYKR